MLKLTRGVRMKIVAEIAVAVTALVSANAAFAQVADPSIQPGIPAPAPGPVQIKIPEGTEFPIRLEEAISSSTATEGDRFTISLDDDVKLSDGTVLRAGYRGVGEVIEAHDNGMLGKNGKLNVRLVHLKVGDERIRLRANKGAKGEGRVGATVATVILFWPAAPFIRGKDVSMKKGTIMTAYSDQDTILLAPLPAPPVEAD